MAAEVNPNVNVRPYHQIDGLTTIYVNLGLPLCVSLLFETAEKAERFAKIISDSNLMIYKGWLNLSDSTYADNNPLVRSYAIIPEKDVPPDRLPLITIRDLIHMLGYVVKGTDAAGPVHNVTIMPVDFPIKEI